MADPKGYIFDKDATTRTRAVVKIVENHRPNNTGDPDPNRFPTRWFYAVIVANSFTDCRYTVGRAYITNDNTDDANAKIEITEFVTDDPLHLHVTANNLDEFSFGTHSLPVGMPVVVHYDYDGGNPTTPRYWFQGGSNDIGQDEYQLSRMGSTNSKGWGYAQFHELV